MKGGMWEGVTLLGREFVGSNADWSVDKVLRRVDEMCRITAGSAFPGPCPEVNMLMDESLSV